jgi:hypothetical protein
VTWKGYLSVAGGGRTYGAGLPVAGALGTLLSPTEGVAPGLEPPPDVGLDVGVELAPSDCVGVGVAVAVGVVFGVGLGVGVRVGVGVGLGSGALLVVRRTGVVLPVLATGSGRTRK